MKLLIIAGLVLAMALPAQASLMRAQEPKSLPVSCDTVKLMVKSFTREHLEKMAVAYGITLEQRREAMQCLRRTKKSTE